MHLIHHSPKPTWLNFVNCKSCRTNVTYFYFRIKMVRKTAQKSDVKAMSVSKPSKAVKKPKAGDDKVKKVVKEAKKTVNVTQEVKKEEKKVKATTEVKKVEKPKKKVKAVKEVETEENVELPTIKSHPEMQVAMLCLPRHLTTFMHYVMH